MPAFLAAMLALSGCGRIHFGADGGGGGGPDAALDGGGGGLPVEVGRGACGETATELTLVEPVPAGDTLLIAFFMREPLATPMPTIDGAGLVFTIDASYTTTDPTNRRHVSLFRADAEADLPAGTRFVIDRPGGRASGAVALRAPGTVRPINGEAPAYAEGSGPLFDVSDDTRGDAVLCLVTHHNIAGVTFGSEWTPLFGAQVDCGGETRTSASLHGAVAPGAGRVACSGQIRGSLQWAIAFRTYEGLAAR